MDKTFEDIISETLNDLSTENTQETDNVQDNQEVEGTANSDYQEEASDDVVENTSEDTQESENIDENNDGDDVDNSLDLEEVEETPSMNQKDAQAFARMRTELKQSNNDLNAAKNIIQFFDVRAKQMGLNGIQDLMEKTVEAEMNKQAKKEGIPVDVLKRINELENKVRQQDIERDNIIKSQKEREVNYVLDEFMQKHSLSQEAVNKLANSLVSDGFNFNALMNMPRSAVSRILDAYLPKESLKQEDLVKKEQIKKEVPPTGSTSSGPVLDDVIDKMAKKWAGLS